MLLHFNEKHYTDIEKKFLPHTVDREKFLLQEVPMADTSNVACYRLSKDVLL